MWQTEERFINEWAELLPNLAGSAGYSPVIWKEPRTEFGRPDILLANVRPSVVEERVAQLKDRTRLTRAGAYAMAFLVHRRWTSFDSLASHLGITPAKALAVGAELEARGLIHRRDACIRARALRQCLAIHSVVAFEAKLREWRRGVAQAMRHLWFAHASYVVLAHVTDSLISKAAAACRESLVGLIVPDTAGHPRVAVPSSRGTQRHTYLTWLLNERLVDDLARHPIS